MRVQKTLFECIAHLKGRYFRLGQYLLYSIARMVNEFLLCNFITTFYSRSGLLKLCIDPVTIMHVSHGYAYQRRGAHYHSKMHSKHSPAPLPSWRTSMATPPIKVKQATLAAGIRTIAAQWRARVLRLLIARTLQMPSIIGFR